MTSMTIARPRTWAVALLAATAGGVLTLPVLREPMVAAASRFSGMLGDPAGQFGAVSEVVLSSPRTGVVFGAPAAVPLAVKVADGTFLSRVDFFVNGQLVGTTRTAPHAYIWQGQRAGTYTVSAAAYATSGARIDADTTAQITLRDLERLPLVEAAPVVGAASLVYEGAFRLPGGMFNTSRFGWSGRALSFSAERQSLFLIGHEQHQQAAEITIPEIRSETVWTSYDVAGVKQGFFDPIDGKRAEVLRGDPNGLHIGGLLPYNGRLLANAVLIYDSAYVQKQSIFVSGFDLSQPKDALGPFAVTGPMTGYVAGYMGVIPMAWRQLLGGPAFTGNCCINIIGRTSYGPAAFSFDPDVTGKVEPVPTNPLVYYTATQPLAPFNGKSEQFNGTTRIAGAVMPDGTRSMLFFGTQGLGEFCYGTGATCKDPMYADNGTHAYPYVHRVWAYDALQLAQVRAGRLEPWAVKPYATWTLEVPMVRHEFGFRGVTYDPGTGRILVAARRGEEPLIHSYRVVVR